MDINTAEKARDLLKALEDLNGIKRHMEEEYRH